MKTLFDLLLLLFVFYHFDYSAELKLSIKSCRRV